MTSISTDSPLAGGNVYVYENRRTAIDQSLSPIEWVLDESRYTTKKFVTNAKNEKGQNPESALVPVESDLVGRTRVLTKILGPDVEEARTNSFVGVSKNLSNALEVKNTRLDDNPQVFYSFSGTGETVFNRDFAKLLVPGENPKDYVVRSLETGSASNSRSSAKTQEWDKINEPIEQRCGLNTRHIYKK